MEATRISLALQGGGAHGAFTWGVLDHLLEQPDLAIAGISGTSAGALNGCILAQGLISGAAQAREDLAHFWRRISEVGAAAFNPYQSTPYHSMARAWNLDWAPASLWLDVMAQFVSPYQLNPLDHNPLRELLASLLDFERLRAAPAVPLFVCATNLQTNQLRLFGNAELSVDALLASACLPQLHRAVRVEDSYSWDGGFMGNPVLKPLIRECLANDLVIVQLNPIERQALPISARDIMDRLNEITMNAALMRELDTIDTITRLIERGSLNDPHYRAVYCHSIADPVVMGTLGLTSKSNTAWPFLTYLRDSGRLAAERWLQANRTALGQRSTMDLSQFRI